MKVHYVKPPRDWGTPVVWHVDLDGRLMRMHRDAVGNSVRKHDASPPEVLQRALYLINVCYSGRYVGAYYKINTEGEVEVTVLYPNGIEL